MSSDPWVFRHKPLAEVANVSGPKAKNRGLQGLFLWTLFLHL